MTPGTYSFRIAHFTIYDVPVLAVLADARFDGEPASERQRIYSAVKSQLGATNADAQVVLVWPDAEGRTRFIAPVQQHRFFEVMKYDQLRAHADCSLTLMPA